MNNEKLLNILSLHFGHDGSVAVFKAGRLAAAIASERLTRFKKQRGVTWAVVENALEQAGLKWSDIHMVLLTGWQPAPEDGTDRLDKTAAAVTVTKNDGKPLTHEEYRKIYLAGGYAWGWYTFNHGPHRAPCMLMDHHFAHCAYAFYMSPFDDAVVLSVDGGDDFNICHSVYYFCDSTKKATAFRRGADFNVGVYYGMMCDYLGFYPNVTDAGKVMALAAYGKPHVKLEDLCWESIHTLNDVLAHHLALHTLVRHGVKNIPDLWTFHPPLKGEGGAADPDWLDKKDWRNELNCNIAATAQAVLERSVHDLLRKLADTTRSLTRNLCLSGGTMLNCVNNAKLLHSGIFDQMFIAPAAGDDGLSVGAGLHIAASFELDDQSKLVKRKSPRPRYNFREAFEGGRCYSPEQIQAGLERFAQPLQQSGITVRKLNSAEVVEFAADRIVADKVVGWFYRGSELGPRALGHRSILANPRNKDMKDILNSRVKHREEFRPFAPVVLQEHAEEWFDLRGNTSPFMLYSVACRKPDQIPSAVHIDGTARVQTVDRENNGRFYDLIERLHQKTGVPIVLNTSFNVQGEPIVETPDDAIRCFLGTQIDALILEDYVMEKGT